MVCIKDYLKLIFNSDLIDDLLKKNQKEEEFVSPNEIRDVLEKYKDVLSECTECTPISHQEIPGWIGKLLYKDNRIYNKDIIIIGQETSDEISFQKAVKTSLGLKKSNVHIWYDLGIFVHPNNLINVPEHDLWKYLDLILDLNKDLDRIYGTDLAKCYTSKEFKDKARSICADQYLVEELNCFKKDGLILIFNGKTVKDELTKFMELEKDQDFFNFLDTNQELLKREYNIKINQKGEYIFEIGKFIPKKNLDVKGRYIAVPHNVDRYNIWFNLLKKRNEEFTKCFFEKIKKFLS